VPTSGVCSISELAEAIRSHEAELGPVAYYLAALLLGEKSDFVVPLPRGFTLGSFTLLQSQPSGALKDKAIAFMAFGNALRVLYRRVQLLEMLERYGRSVVEYGRALNELSNSMPVLRDRLSILDDEGRALSRVEPREPFANIRSLLEMQARNEDWSALRLSALRYINTPQANIAGFVKRMLALSLGQSDETADKEAAIELYQCLIGDHLSDVTDVGHLALLLLETGNVGRAKSLILDKIKLFPEKASYFSEIAQLIVSETGDRRFRHRVADLLAGRENGR
jgi:hypothetical protein